MIQIYQQEWHVFKQHYARIFILVLGICIISSIVTYVVLVNQPDTAIKIMEMVGKQLQSQAERFGGSLDGTNSELFLFIVKNNLYVSSLVFLLGFIPLVILPFFSPFVSILSIGVMLAGFQVLGESPMKALVTGILPHGVIEIIAIILAATIGMYTSLQIFKKLFSQNRSEIQLRTRIWEGVRSFFLIVVPLIVLAALIEGFITPMLMNLVY